jgi:hypothetical protein
MASDGDDKGFEDLVLKHAFDFDTIARVLNARQGANAAAAARRSDVGTDALAVVLAQPHSAAGCRQRFAALWEKSSPAKAGARPKGSRGTVLRSSAATAEAKEGGGAGSVVREGKAVPVGGDDGDDEGGAMRQVQSAVTEMMTEEGASW